MVHGHAGAVDLIAQALLNAEAMLANDALQAFKQDRYAGWKAGIGADMLAGKLSLSEMAETALKANESPAPRSGRQEHLENVVNRAVMGFKEQ